MKNIYFLLLLAFQWSSNANAQTTLHSNNFSGGASGWNLEEANNFDTWVVNSVYNCSPDNTPDNGGGNYLHIYDDLSPENCAVANFLGFGSSGTCYATMTSGVSTLGYGTVTISFSWLCKGQTGALESYGGIEYSINSGGVWSPITNPKSKFSGQSTWTTVSISSLNYPSFANQADLRFRFKWTNSGYGANPSFAIDNILITGTIGIVCNNVGGTATANPSEVCNSLTSIINLASFTGNIQWQESPDGSSWGNVTGGTGATTSSYTTEFLTSSKYYRAVVSQSGCPDQFSSAAFVKVTSFVNASVSITSSKQMICDGEEVSFSATSLNKGDAPAFQWTINSSAQIGNDSIFNSTNLKNNDNVYCSMTSSLPCVNVQTVKSNSIIMQVSICNAVTNIERQNGFSVIPNPARKIFEISSSETILIIRIYNIEGQLLKVIQNEEGKKQVEAINLNQLSGGIYFLQAVTENGTVSRKLILE